MVALKCRLLPCPRPHPSLPRGSPPPASHLRSKELQAEPHGRDGPRRGFEVRALGRQRKGHSLRWPLGFYRGSWRLWHHSDAIQGSGAAVRSRDPSFPRDAQELCDRLSTQIWRSLPPCRQLYVPSPIGTITVPPCPASPRSPRLTCTARPSTRIPPLRADSSRKMRLVRGSTEYPMGTRVPGESHTGEGMRAAG